MPEADIEADARPRVVIVGAGPAGLAAAQALAAERLDAVLLDAAPQPGGQVWRARQGVVAPPVARALGRLARAGVPVLAGTRVAMSLPGRWLLVDGPGGARRLRWSHLVLATGARERLLPFPGWTLPGVFGAGGLQALVKGGWPIRGKRVLVAGTGPLLLAVAATLRREGAVVVGLVEEVPPAGLARFAGTLAAHPRQALQALKLGAALLGVPLLAGWRVVAARGNGRVERVLLQAEGGRTRTIECDALAASWGLIPQTDLAQLLGCALVDRFGAPAIAVDAGQRTNVDGVFAIGECTGVAGADAARQQGAAAGLAIGDDLDLDGVPPRPARASRRLVRANAFAAAVAATFSPPADWAGRLRDDTLVCRCEDVPWSALRGQPDLRAAKLATRCGMGHCQGRLCHDTLASVMHWPRLPLRTPLAPAPLAVLLAIPDTPDDSLENPP
jgi:NADPH-dependent 2,4-dienoyl-CoA reductase/sulfur reductase-like enzyme